MSHFSNKSSNHKHEDRRRSHHNVYPNDSNIYRKEYNTKETNSHYGKKNGHSVKMENGDPRRKPNSQASTYVPQSSTKYHYDTAEQRHYNYSDGRTENVTNESRFQSSGQMRSGHVELNSLYGGNAGTVQINAMNAPNNSTMQCGCENIDCPFCNLMTSVEMKQ